MSRPRQFSLAYLMLEVFWIAVALVFVRAIFLSAAASPPSIHYAFALNACFMTAAGVAVGGLIRKMLLGAVVGFALGVLLCFLLHLLTS